jgi:4'-phosphopantetheinyl transferase
MDSARRRSDPHELPRVVDGVSLWWCDLDLPVAEVERQAAMLSPAEHARAAHFGTDALRRRWIAGRTSLRRVLGAALRMAPGEVPIVRGPRGRPELRGLDETCDFNVSHTGNVALIGIRRNDGRDARIGVDVERASRQVGADRLARKFLTQAESDAIAALDPDDRRQRFLQYWTCKEAMSKATGDGLLAPFRNIEVALRDAPRLVGGPAPYQPAAWTLFSAPVPDGHFATVALWERGDFIHQGSSDTSSASAAKENPPGSRGPPARPSARIAP